MKIYKQKPVIRHFIMLVSQASVCIEMYLVLLKPYHSRISGMIKFLPNDKESDLPSASAPLSDGR